MATKNAYKIIVSFGFIFLFCPFIKGQNKNETINIIFKDDLKHYAKVENQDAIFFYINRETFVFIKSKDNKIKILKENDVKKDTLFPVNEILEKLYKIDDKGIIHISKKSERFGTIFLYEFREGLVYRYSVKWQDATSDWGL